MSGSCLIAVALLAIALQGYWARATSAHNDCDYLRGRGTVELCAPAPEADAAYSMVCAAFPLMVAALFFAFMSAMVTMISPYGAKGTAAALAGASFAAAFAAGLSTTSTMLRHT